jgi:hypothetical protein
MKNISSMEWGLFLIRVVGFGRVVNSRFEFTSSVLNVSTSNRMKIALLKIL